MDKLVLAAEELAITDVALAGGVSANSGLRQTTQDVGEAKGWRTFIPAFQYCTDDTTMIGMAGQFRLDAGQVARRSAWHRYGRCGSGVAPTNCSRNENPGTPVGVELQAVIEQPSHESGTPTWLKCTLQLKFFRIFDVDGGVTIMGVTLL